MSRSKRIETAEHRVAEAPPGTFTIVAIIILGAVVGVAYWSERAYRRWWTANQPFAGSIARIGGMGATYRERRASLSEAVQVIRQVVAGIGRALEHE